MIVLLLGCKAHPCAEGELVAADGTCVGASTSDRDDTAEPPADWVELPPSCEAPAESLDDPLVVVGYDKKGQDNQEPRFMEFTNVLVAGARVIGIGQGGMLTYDVADPTDPSDGGWYPEQNGGWRYHRMVLVDDLLVLSRRDQGLSFFQDDDEGGWLELGEFELDGAEGLAWHEDVLTVSVRGEGLRAYDLSTAPEPTLLSQSDGPLNSWMLSEVVDGWTYAADSSGGVVPIDLSDPEAPVVHPAVELDGAALHVEATDEVLYVSAGGYGVHVLDRSDPASPSLVGTLATGGSVVMSSVADRRLWAADHVGVVVWELSEPTAPTPLAREVTEQFALAIDADEDIGWVGDWNYMLGLELQDEVLTGQIQLPDQDLDLPGEGGHADLPVRNLGGGTLELLGAKANDGRVHLQVDAASLEPGETGTLRVDFEGGDALDTTLCLATTDPDRPTIELQLVSGDHHDWLGQPAADFTLTDLDGTTHQLGEELGHVVVLAFFAPW